MKRVTVENIEYKPLAIGKHRPHHGDEEFIKAANAAIAESIECEDIYIDNYGEKGWQKRLDKLRELMVVDKQGFIYYYLKVHGIKEVSDIGESYFNLLEAEGEIKGRRTWPKGF